MLVDADMQGDDFELPMIFFAVVPDAFMERMPERAADPRSLAVKEEEPVHLAFDRWSF